MSRDQKEKEVQLQEFVQQVEKLHPTNTSAFIFKVPDELKNANKPFFEPKTISIGPIHSKKQNLSVANEMKKWYLKSFLSRLGKAGNSKDMLIKLLISLEPNARECYKDVDFQTDKEFLEIMLLDGCFIVELLLRHNWKQVSQEVVFGKEEKVPLHTLQQDLLKLENQLPFFVLNYLSQLCHKPSNAANDQILIDAALNFFRIPVKPDNTLQHPRHLLELVMFYSFPYSPISSQTTNIPGPEVVVVHQSSLSKSKSASELELYGIKFKPRHGTKPTDIIFSNNGVLSIPPLEIQESTESLFWNFLIFEMCSSDERIFSSYLLMIDTLVDNENDVDLLIRSGVIKTRINDKKRLVSLFNDLSVNLPQKDFNFDSLLQQVNKYCESRRVRAYFVRNYYDARWDVLNSVLLFILTVTQTLFSILAYNPKQK